MPQGVLRMGHFVLKICGARDGWHIETFSISVVQQQDSWTPEGPAQVAE